MKTLGLLISHKNKEKRRAIIPSDLPRLANLEHCLFEYGYGDAIGYSDADYAEHGARFGSREDVLKQDILVDVKLGDADYLDEVQDGRILFGWAHAVQSVDFTTKVLAGKHTVYAWEELYEESRYIFYRNREIAGEAAIMHAFTCLGKMPYDTEVAIIGNGQTAKGAMRMLHGFGANVDVYTRRLESLFKKKMFDYDVIVNCVLWDTSRTDRLIYKEDLVKFRPGSMIIDISCDPNLEIETSRATTIDDPIYVVDGVIHYAVDNTPAMFSHSVSRILSNGIVPYLNQLMESEEGAILSTAKVIEAGKIKQQAIIDFRKLRGLTLE